MSRTLQRIATVAGSTGASRVLGLVRDLLAARVFGAGELHSAFVTAYTLPNLFRRLLGEGALSGAFVPVLTAEERERGRAAMLAFADDIFTWLAATTAALTVLGVLALGALSWIPGYDARWDRMVPLAQVLLPYCILACGAAAQAAALNVLGSFAIPALAQVWLNLAMIVGLNVFGLAFAETPEGRMAWLCGSVLVGGLLQVAIPARALWRYGWRPRLRLRWTPRVREVALLLVPGIAGAAVYQINVATSRFLAFDLNEAAATLLYLASRLMELPIGVFSIAVATVVFPLLARAAADGDAVRFEALFRRGTRLTLVIALPSALGLLLLASPIVRVLFQHGNFTAADGAALAPVLAVYALGLPFLSLIALVTRAFHAVKDLRTPFHAALLSFVVNVVLALTLPRWFSTPGLAAATNLALLAQLVFLLVRLKGRFPAVRLGGVVPDLVRIGVACGVLALVVGGGWVLWEGALGRTFAGDAAVLAVGIPVGVAAYGATLWAVRLEGREEAAAALARLLARIRR